MKLMNRGVLLSIVLSSFVAGDIHAQREEDEIAFRVRAMGGRVERDYEQPRRPIVSVWPPRDRRWESGFPS